MVTGPAANPWKAGETRVNKMCFIGRNLDHAALEEGFLKCLIKPGEVYHGHGHGHGHHRGAEGPGGEDEEEEHAEHADVDPAPA